MTGIVGNGDKLPFTVNNLTEGLPVTYDRNCWKLYRMGFNYHVTLGRLPVTYDRNCWKQSFSPRFLGAPRQSTGDL